MRRGVFTNALDLTYCCAGLAALSGCTFMRLELAALCYATSLAEKTTRRRNSPSCFVCRLQVALAGTLRHNIACHCSGTQSCGEACPGFRFEAFLCFLAAARLVFPNLQLHMKPRFCAIA